MNESINEWYIYYNSPSNNLILWLVTRWFIFLDNSQLLFIYLLMYLVIDFFRYECLSIFNMNEIVFLLLPLLISSTSSSSYFFLLLLWYHYYFQSFHDKIYYHLNLFSLSSFLWKFLPIYLFALLTYLDIMHDQYYYY